MKRDYVKRYYVYYTSAQGPLDAVECKNPPAVSDDIPNHLSSEFANANTFGVDATSKEDAIKKAKDANFQYISPEKLEQLRSEAEELSPMRCDYN